MLTDMEGLVKGVNGAGRDREQGLATVITLIFAGQQSRCRMTVSRHGDCLGLETRVHDRKVVSRFLGDSADLDPDLRRTPMCHAAARSCGTSWPTDQTKPASSRATAVMAFGRPIRAASRW